MARGNGGSSISLTCVGTGNGESHWRGETFVTRKITRAVECIHAGLDQHLWMGNIDAVLDWGAPEYVEGMWRMMQIRP